MGCLLFFFFRNGSKDNFFFTLAPQIQPAFQPKFIRTKCTPFHNATLARAVCEPHLFGLFPPFGRVCRSVSSKERTTLCVLVADDPVSLQTVFKDYLKSRACCFLHDTSGFNNLLGHVSPLFAWTLSGVLTSAQHTTA